MVVLSAFGFGTISILVTFATATGAPVLSLLLWRYAIAAVLLAGVAWMAGTRRWTNRAWPLVIVAGLMQAVIAGVSMSALKYIPAGTLGFLFYTYPAWVALIARVMHSEPLTPLRLFALGLSLAGIFVMVGAGEGMTLHPIGVALALASALLYAAYVPMIGVMQRGLGDAETSAYVSVGAAVFLGIGAAFMGHLTATLHPTAWLSVAGLAVISTVAAFLLFLRGLRALGPVRTAIVSTVEPFFTSVLGAMLLAQPFTRRSLIGGTLIAVAVILLQLRPGGNGAGRAD
ncbi:MAG TPA: DMT family transporter [Gemmatimonadaceae bacterium]|nr:DMT family transporter [Gemmatimonadaceae bacterium]